MPADASPAATDRPEPSGRAAGTDERAATVVPTPRSAPPAEDAPESADPAAPTVSAHPAAATVSADPATVSADPGAVSADPGAVSADPVAATADVVGSAAGTVVPADVAGAASGSDGSPAVVPAEAVPAQRVPADRSAPDTLTEREERILAFEQQWWKHAGAKEQAIRDTFGLSATRYYQLLNALLDRPAALAAEPVLIGRLRRLRSSRARNRRR